MRKSYPFLFKNICISLILFITLSLFAPAATVMAKSKSSGNTDYTEGDNVFFGNLDNVQLNWTILTYDSETGIAFVVLKSPLNSKSVQDYKKQLCTLLPDEQHRGFINWAGNGWRTWLNSAFLQNAFTSAQRQQIQRTSITKESQQNSIMNFFHDTSLDAAYARDQVKYDMDLDIYNNQVATSDFIFFLSTDEYTSYKDKIVMNGATEKWALRTNSYYTKNRTNCVDESNGGMIEPYYHYNNTAIRPAMYVKIKEVVRAEEEASKDSSSKNNNTVAKNTTDNQTTKNTSSTNTAAVNASVQTRQYANNATDVNAVSGDRIALPDDAEHNMSSGGTAVAAIDLSYLNNSHKKYTVTYASSDNSIFTVDSAGNVSALKAGSAILSVRMKKSNGKIYNMSCRINVS